MVFWHGDAAEQVALLQAVARNCTCSSDDGIVNGSCPAHRALLDQRWLDHVLFYRHIAPQLLAEEFFARQEPPGFPSQEHVDVALADAELSG